MTSQKLTIRNKLLCTHLQISCHLPNWQENYLFISIQTVCFSWSALQYKWPPRSCNLISKQGKISTFESKLPPYYSPHNRFMETPLMNPGGRNKPWSLYFSIPMIDIWRPQTYVTKRGLRWSLPSGKLYCVPTMRCLQRRYRHRRSKILFIYLKPGPWFSRPWFSFL